MPSSKSIIEESMKELGLYERFSEKIIFLNLNFEDYLVGVEVKKSLKFMQKLKY